MLEPLATRLRPALIEDFFGQQHSLTVEKPLRVSLQQGKLHSMIFWGPPGTGKTTLARIIARQAYTHVESISAVFAGVKDIRAVVTEAQQRIERGIVELEEGYQQPITFPTTLQTQLAADGDARRCLNFLEIIVQLAGSTAKKLLINPTLLAQVLAVYTAFKQAMSDAKHYGSLPVPKHLCSAPTKLMKKIGYAKNYRYAHDEQTAYAADENYFPEEMPQKIYYQPVQRGLEIKMSEKSAKLRQLDSRNTNISDSNH